MNFQFSYKGQTVSITSDNKTSIKKNYDLAISKFKHHFTQELSLFGDNVKLRLKRNNELLEWKDTASAVLVDNDTVFIEPKDNVLTVNSQNCHMPKRYDISNIENTFSKVILKQPDSSNAQSIIKGKSSNNIQHEVVSSKANRYQKSETPNQSKENHNNPVNNFDRNGLRRSLGAGFALQCELPSLREYSNFFGSNTNNSYKKELDSSDSSISDIYPKHKSNSKRKSNKSGDVYNKRYGLEDRKLLSKSAPASPSKPPPPVRSPRTHLSMINAHNVRTIGKKINISILKKPNIGLGFTIVTRDNPVYSSGADLANSIVILVNKILKNGGAADDGRLKPGDRILEVNSVPVTSLKDTTDKLRSIPENTSVELLISRIDKDESPNNTSNLPKSFPQLTFEIPLNSRQKENQQLGLNIHYRNEKDSPPLGPGIYIHSILGQSLASQQGGLQNNDKLVGVNGQSLTDLNVEATIGLLKKAILNNSVLAITVFRESPLNQSLDQMDIIASKLVPNTDNSESSLKPSSSQSTLPNKMTIDQISKKSKTRHDTRNPINNNRYSSSESGSQYETDMYNSRASNAFEREGVGRRSMSEKGKFHEDASKYKFYKETRDRTAQSKDRSYTTERAYSTLPTASHKKKMQDQSPPPLPNKAPTKPSQIKIKNAQESAPKSTNGTPNRSASLRDSTASHKSHSPKRYSQTPTHDLPMFNRPMNNSFKKAVQRSNEYKQTSQPTNSLSHSVSRHQTNPTNVTQSEKEYQNFTQIQNKQPIHIEKIPRSNSVKNTEKKKSFNIKDFLTFTPNVSQSAKYHVTGKSDTFPPDKHPDPQLPNYQSVHPNDPKHRPYSPIELPLEFQHCKDQTIIDSTKRVLEWQKKNADVISKENKLKEKIYQPISQSSNENRIQKRRKSKIFNLSLLACCSASGKTKVDLNLRNPSTNKSSNQYHCETDPYETIDGTVTSPNGQTKLKSSRSHPRSAYSAIYGVTGAMPSTKNGCAPPRSNIIIPYQTNSNSRKTTTSIATDIYATVNKPSKKEVPIKPTANISQLHKNKYKF